MPRGPLARRCFSISAVTSCSDWVAVMVDVVGFWSAQIASECLLYGLADVAPFTSI
jgi:hypothetical protein